MPTIRIGHQQPPAALPVRGADEEERVLDGKAIRERALHGERPRGLTPICLSCGRDDALVYTTYSEQVILPNGRTRHARITYCCARCGRSRDHEVPASWRPPGWFWCT
ncbi:hypothetical protein [Arthrobacter sp. TMS1-12-1]